MFWIICTLILPLISCGDVKLKQIFTDSKNAIDSNSTSEIQDVLSKYYFTTAKESSIWYLAQKEANELFGMEMEIESLQFIETLLKRLAGHYQHCITMEKSVERSQCFAGLAAMLKDTEKGARWHTDPDMEVGEKAKFGALYNSVAAMSALLSVVSMHEMKQFENPHERKEKMHRFEHVIFKMISDMQGSNEYDHDIVEFRLDQIGPVTICDTVTHFWKEFEGSCETRWTNMAFDEAHKNQIKLRSNISSPPRDVKPEGGDRATDTEASIPEDKENRNTVDDMGVDIATLIGGDLGPTKKRYKTFVIDASNDKTVFEKYFVTEVGSRADAMDLATKEALVERGKEELKVKEDVMAYVNGTFYINMKLLKKTLELIKV